MILQCLLSVSRGLRREHVPKANADADKRTPLGAQSIVNAVARMRAVCVYACACVCARMHGSVCGSVRARTRDAGERVRTGFCVHARERGREGERSGNHIGKTGRAERLTSCGPGILISLRQG